jgi:hypothetical protein
MSSSGRITGLISLSAVTVVTSCPGSGINFFVSFSALAMPKKPDFLRETPLTRLN